MKILAKLFTLFTVVSIVELYLLFQIAELSSWWVAIAMVLIPGMLGAWLAKREGARAFRAVVGALSTGQEPTRALLDGAIVLVASAFLITPGTLSARVGYQEIAARRHDDVLSGIDARGRCLDVLSETISGGPAKPRASAVAVSGGLGNHEAVSNSESNSQHRNSLQVIGAQLREGV